MYTQVTLYKICSSNYVAFASELPENNDDIIPKSNFIYLFLLSKYVISFHFVCCK